MKDIESLLIDPEETAKLLGIGRTKCYELIAAGIIPNVKIGRLRRVIKAELNSVVEYFRNEGKNGKA